MVNTARFTKKGSGAEPLTVAVEGVIGVGKTTLAKAMADQLGAVRLFEEEIGNPFLPAFYKNRAKHAFVCQAAFLAGRVDQFSRDLPVGVPVVCDHHLLKDPLFARVNLAGDEWAVYQSLYRRMAPQAVFRPRVIVYLTAPLDEVRRRIRERGRRMEAGIDLGYLKALVEAYEAWFASEEAARERVVVVSADGAGVAGDPEAVGRLLDACLQARPGLQYCNPIA